jgi:NADH dehydrogenase [ubiquinone] 1 alpha subcomplex assembly factor 7
MFVCVCARARVCVCVCVCVYVRVIQVCLDAVRVCVEIQRRITSSRHGGSALIIDYGDAVIAKDTLRAFRKHKEAGVFDEPGTADLTSDVNFGHIANIFARAEPSTQPLLPMLGPITQRQFLLSMAIQARAEVLCRGVEPRQANAIKLQVGCV